MTSCQHRDERQAEALAAAVAALDARDEEWERALAGLKLYTHETEEP